MSHRCVNHSFDMIVYTGPWPRKDNFGVLAAHNYNLAIRLQLLLRKQDENKIDVYLKLMPRQKNRKCYH